MVRRKMIVREVALSSDGLLICDLVRGDDIENSALGAAKMRVLHDDQTPIRIPGRTIGHQYRHRLLLRTSGDTPKRGRGKN